MTIEATISPREWGITGISRSMTIEATISPREWGITGISRSMTIGATISPREWDITGTSSWHQTKSDCRISFIVITIKDEPLLTTV